MHIRIYQVNPDRDEKRVAFQGFNDVYGYGQREIDSGIYDCVYSGNVGCKDLEDVYRKFNSLRIDLPDGYKGRSLSVSDVVEVIEDAKVKPGFYFCDNFGFRPVPFKPNLEENAPERCNRLFVDMDGTLARFHDEVQYLERMYEPDFFRNLKPFQNAVETIRTYIRENPKAEVYILSSTVPGEPPGCARQKHEWLDRYLPEIDRAHRLFPEIGTPKNLAVPGGIRPGDLLLDDYNKNLEEWRQAGGCGIKFVNNINDRAMIGERWNGLRLYHDADPRSNALSLAHLTGGQPTRQPKRGTRL